MVEHVGGSFRDPCSRVYAISDTTVSGGIRILRGIDEETKVNFETLVAQDFYKTLLKEGRLVNSKLVDDKGDKAAADIVIKNGWAGVLEHQTIPFINYPYEWTFGMLRMAALLHLRLLTDALNNGWTLKDSTPFNIQFVGCRPVFIDLPSFVPWEEGEPWLAYRQFCSCFLTPLLMRAHLGIDHLPIMRSYIDGIPPTEAVKFFNGLSRFKKGVMSHIIFPAEVENRIASKERDAVPAKKRQAAAHKKPMVLGLVDSMTRLVQSLTVDIGHTDWSDYDQTHTYDNKDHELKKSFVESVVAGKDAAFIWDIGCNTGTFSQISAAYADNVIAVDGDHNAIEKLFQAERAKKKDTPILPLVLNLANLSPNQGWAGEERSAFDERVKPDVVLVLALVHHIRISSNIPMDLFLDWLRRLECDVVIEFINREDEMVVKLLTNKKVQYKDYNIETFVSQIEQSFNIASREKLKDGKREIFHLTPA